MTFVTHLWPINEVAYKIGHERSQNDLTSRGKLVPIDHWHVTLSMSHLHYIGLGDRVAPATTGNIWSSELLEDIFDLKSQLYLLGLKRFILICY